MVRFNHERINDLLIERGFKRVNLFWRRGNDTVFRLNGMGAYLFISGKKERQVKGYYNVLRKIKTYEKPS